MSDVLDMATALDLTLDDAQEQKFNALKNLHAKKVKYLMVSIDAKDKEISKLKVLGKDNRRTQMIQALRNKLREQELVTDVVKQELSQKSDMSLEEVNGLIIRKTLGGPKRFRPLTREELENHITDMEKKLTKKTGSVVPTGPVGNAGGGGSVAGSHAGRTTNGARSSASHAPSRVTKNVAGNNRDLISAQHMLTAGGMGNSDADLNTLAKLGEEVHNLRILLDAKDSSIEQQKEDISRLRARNSELRTQESDMGQQEREEHSLKLQCIQLKDDLEMTTKRLLKCEEENKQMGASKMSELEECQAKLEGVEQQCEKLLKSNGSLLKKLAEVERELEDNVEKLTRAGTMKEREAVGVESKDRRIGELDAKIDRMDEKRKALEQQISDMHREIAQYKAQGDKLREANTRIRELDKELEAMTKERDEAKVIASSFSLAGGRTIDELFKENKSLKQALAVALSTAGAIDEDTGVGALVGEEKVGK